MLLYILQVTSIWAVCYLFYIAFLKKETFFSVNRWYLLSTFLIGLAIPFVQIPSFEDMQSPVMTVYTGTIDLTEAIITAQPQASSFDIWTVLLAIYWLGALVVASRFLYGLFQIFNLYKSAEITRYSTYTLVSTSKAHLPFSFFKWVFWSTELDFQQEEKDNVLRHETAHVNQGHTVDVLIMELANIFLWCSPMIYFYKKSIRTVHEYLADAVVLKTTKKKQYGHLLLKQTQSGLQLALTHQFFQSQLKQRIMMMSKDKSQKSEMAKYLLALPILFVLAFLFSKRDLIAQQSPSVNELSVVDTIPTSNLGLNGSNEVIYIIDGKESSKSAMESINPDDIATINVYKNESAEKVFGIKEGSVIEITTKAYAEAPKPENEFIWAKALIIYEGQSIPWDTAKELLQTKCDVVEYTLERGIKIYGDQAKNGVIEIKDCQGSLINVVASKAVFKEVDSMPRFPGCEQKAISVEELNNCSKQELLMFVYKNVKYPKAAIAKNISGTVVVNFVVEADGSITKPKIKRSIGGGCDEEVLRVVGEMPLWVPGTNKGEAVAVEFNLPVKFKFDDEKSDCDEEQSTRNAYKEVDEMPRFPGCEDKGLEGEAYKECHQLEMLKFIYTNIKYPKDAREAGIEGVVVVNFVIDENGIVTDPIIKREIGGGCEEAVLEVVGLMPTWIPGIKDGKNVATEFNLPVKFKLEGDKKEPAKERETQTDNELKLTNLSTYPNPATDELTLKFNAPDAGLVRVILTDVNGKVTNIYTNKMERAGAEFTRLFDVSKVARGPLFVKIEQGGKAMTTKVILQ